MQQSEDNRVVDGVQQPRDFFGYRTLDFGDANVNEVWNSMLRDAAAINNANVDYDLFGPNSNSTVGYILNRQGIDIQNVLPNNPEIDGSWFTDPYPGIEDINDIANEIPHCFPAGTLITLADGSKKAIDLITTSDKVLTFDDDGNPYVGEVVRTYTNTTPGFIRLSFDDGRDDLVATPGHAFLTETGDYLELGYLARLGGGVVRLVDGSGEIVSAKAERLVYSAETAHLFANSVGRSMSVAGNLAFKEDVTEGWATHNFEVRTTHNYVAGNIRVHNKSGPIGQLGDSLDTGLDRLSGVRDGDGSFLDKASDLINAGMHVVDRAMKNVSAVCHAAYGI